MAVAAAGSTLGIARGAIIHSANVQAESSCLYLSNSEVVDAVDQIRMTSPRPAVINYSAAGDCSGGGPGCGFTSDDAMKRAANSGITVVVGAGNGASNACGYSPAHVPELLTVAASIAFTDARWAGSNFGPCVDIFAPVLEDGGTSTATAYTSGVAALELQLYPSKNHYEVVAAVIGNASENVLTDVFGSPNRLLYSRRPTFLADIGGGFWTMGPSTRCHWYAVVLGGQPPYTYAWTRNNSTVSSSGTYNSLAGGYEDFGLYLQAWDSVGRTSTAAQWIVIDPSNSQYYCGVPE